MCLLLMATISVNSLHLMFLQVTGKVRYLCCMGNGYPENKIAMFLAVVEFK